MGIVVVAVVEDAMAKAGGIMFIYTLTVLTVGDFIATVDIT